MSHIISKSSFIRGCQCHKSLYLHKYHDELRDPLSEAKEAIFASGTSIGELAQQLFPNGINMRTAFGQDIQGAVAHTATLMAKNTDIIYEAAFSSNSLLAYVDILVRDGNSWKIYEVKGSTKVSDTYIWDCAFQYHLLSLCGLNISDVFVVHINNKYVRQGTLDVKELFKTVSVFDKVKAIQNDVAENILLQFNVLNTKTTPAIDIGLQCNAPYPCDFMGHCWKHIPENSVFEISNLRAHKKMALYNSGILSIKDIPDSFKLGKSQKIQVDGVKYNSSHLDKSAVKKFINELEYPLYFMDFETMMPAIPMFNKSCPYQQIPFQYSLHYIDSKETEPLHKEFLAEAIEGKDPREDFILHLLADTEKSGQILVYNQTFEMRMLRELAKDFPLYNVEIHRLIDRIVDLMFPFQKKYIYRPRMKGSHSIKSVLPAMIENISYKDLEIGDGGTAMRTFEQLYHVKDQQAVKKIRHNLLEYCKLDTYAMVLILKKIEELSI